MRQWVDDDKAVPLDKRWVMRCDNHINGERCGTATPPQLTQPSLEALHADGWHIARLSGDICPTCISNGAETKDPHFKEKP